MKIKLASRWGGKRGDSGGEVRYSVGGPYPPYRVTPGPRQRKLFLLDFMRVTQLLTDFEIFQDIKNRFLFSASRGPHGSHVDIQNDTLSNPGESWNFMYVLRGGAILSVKGQA